MVQMGLFDETLKNSDALKKMLEHFDIIYKDILSVFSKNNIKPIESLNKKLDPNFHQAMMEIDDDQKEPGTIIKEIQKGKEPSGLSPWWVNRGAFLVQMGYPETRNESKHRFWSLNHNSVLRDVAAT